jgi:hypothetical protein
MKCKLILTMLVTSFMLLTIVFPPVQFQGRGHNYQVTQHGEM